MIQQQTQFFDLYRTSMRTAADAAKTQLESVERLQNRQLELIRGALEESKKSANEFSQVKSLDELVALQTRLAGSQMERWMDFWSGLWRIAGDNQAAALDQFQTQAKQLREQVQNASSGVREIAKEQQQAAARSERKSA